MKKKNKFFTILKFIIPIIIFIYIFNKVDINKLVNYMANLNIYYFILAIPCGYISQNLVAAYRWKYILKEYYDIEIPYKVSLKYYWQGKFIGYFMPAGIGWDMYRIVKVAKHTSNYEKSIITVVFEKIMGLLSGVVLILCIYPFQITKLQSYQSLINIINKLYIFSILVILLFLIVYMIKKKNKKEFKIIIVIGKFLNKFINKLVLMMTNKKESKQLELTELITPLKCYKKFITVLIITVFIRIFQGVGVNLIFKALNINLPLTVNVFVGALFFIIFMLPISFGSLGVREGSYIILYGLYNINKEVALTVSFLALFCIIVDVLIGGVILMYENIFCKKALKKEVERTKI